MRNEFLAAVLVCVVTCAPLAAMDVLGGKEDMAKKPSQPRLDQLVEANIIAVHAYQVLLAKKALEAVTPAAPGAPDAPDAAKLKADPQCYSPGKLTDDDLRQIVAHQASLLKDDCVEIKKWTDGEDCTFDPAKDLNPILAAPLTLSEKLPVNVFANYLEEAAKANRVKIRAVANLYQTCLEMERDGDVLWDEMFFYIALGLPTYVGQFALPGSDEDFLEVGRKLAPLTCDSPFQDNPTAPFAWQIAGRKIWNWGEKYTHARDQYTVARELLMEPDIRVLVPRIRALGPERIAVIGHSFTMQSHWSSAGSFAGIVGAVLDLENPKIEYKQWYGGGLTASRAYKSFYQDALAWKPTKVLFAVAMRTDQDLADLKAMCKGFADAGAAVYTFDNLRDPSEDSVRNQMGEKVSTETGMTIIEVGQLIAKAPDKKTFVCLDNIHMTESYHRLMAKEWLKFLTRAREAKLAQ